MQKDLTLDKNINRRNTTYFTRRDSTVSSNQKRFSVGKLFSRRNTTLVFLEDSSGSRTQESPVDKFFNKRKKEVISPERNSTVSTVQKDSVVGKIFDRKSKSSLSIRKDSTISKTQDSIVTLNQDSLVEDFFYPRKSSTVGFEKNLAVTKIQDFPIEKLFNNENKIIDIERNPVASTNENIFSISKSSPLERRSIPTVGFYSIGTITELAKLEKPEDCLVIKNKSVNERKPTVNINDFQEGDEFL